MDMKGFEPFTIAIVGIITTFTVIIGIAIPPLTLKYHLAIDLKETYEYNNAQLTLLSLVSEKHSDTYSMYRVIAERNTNSFDDNMQKSLREKLTLLTGSSCFKIVNDKVTILKAENCEPVENTGDIYIFLPYNQNSLVEKLILVYS